MPGTAAKKYEEGIFMKKIVKGILLLAAAAAVVTGCSRIGMGGAEAPTENSVYVAGDGSVRGASVETYQQGSYTEDELKNSAGQKIIDFNSGLGKAASYENAEGSEKLPVAIVSASLGNGTKQTDQPHWLRNTTLRAVSLNLPRRLEIIMCRSPNWIQAGWQPCPVNLRRFPFRMRRGRRWTRRQLLRTDRAWWSRLRDRASL